MFRSVSQDAALPQPMAGRRRTRAQARLEIHERREKFKRAREAMEAQTRDRQLQLQQQQSDPPAVAPVSISASASAPTSAPVAVAAPVPVAVSAPVVTPTKAKSAVVVGASFGAESLPVECTPVKRELMSPPQIRRITVPPGGSVPTIERTPANDMEPVASKMLPTTPTAAATSAKSNETQQIGNNEDVTTAVPRRLPVRGIAQSSSSSTRKRMISFSPERAERPVNEAFEQQKRQRNLKVTEKLQLRLEGIPVKTPEKVARPVSAQVSTTPAAKSPGMSSPVVLSLEAVATPVIQTLRTDTPSLPTTSRTMELDCEELNEVEQSPSSRKPPSRRDDVVSCKKELDFAIEDVDEAKDDEDAAAPSSQCEADLLSQDTLASSQLSMEDGVCKMRDASDGPAQGETTIGFGASMDEASTEFTSTSTIEDVGLFNCETDAEYTGGVYGEGTDGKVTAAMVRGQKVALKRAKPHEGFPEDEAKRRSAFELHYLRKVRHLPGFVQCLGLCDAIEHTCIALEVMDCKLSEYLRRYGKIHEVAGTSGAPGKRRRRITLPFDVAKGLIRQICQPMIVLHEQVNVAHGDLACRNILMRLPPKGYEQKWEPVLKLSDFGRLKTAAHEPTIFDRGFSFYKNCDVGSFAREILFRLLVGEIVPTNCTETRNLHKQLSDVVVTRIPDSAKQRLGPFYRLFMRCAGWGVRPTFREILEHLDDLEYFETTENGLFPLRPSTAPMPTTDCSPQTFMSPDVNRGHKPPSSDSKGQKLDTPTTVNARASTVSAAGAPLAPPRLVPSKSYTVTDVNASSSVAMSSSKLAPKTVNWLKARSVLSHPAPMHKLSRTTTTSSVATVSNATSGPASSSTVAHTPMVGRPAQRLSKKTPPSAGASRRSLQILNQIQHRLHEQERKQQWKN
ncbi:hypothetical protein PINS_up009660 [Pythium insidiosum]|nr:hypothetical protein PINS_up009660 [Pythium insidiosum]